MTDNPWNAGEYWVKTCQSQAKIWSGIRSPTLIAWPDLSMEMKNDFDAVLGFALLLHKGYSRSFIDN